MNARIPGLAKPYVWIQPKGTDEILRRLLDACEYNVDERERENLCSVAHGEIVRLLAALEEAKRLAGQRHSSIAKAVYATVQDSAATWDTASDALIWEKRDRDGPDFQKVTEAHLAEICMRFPQWADDLRDFAKHWNEDDPPLTEEQLAAIEHDVDDEAVERGTRRAMQMVRFYGKLSKVEERAVAAEADVTRLRSNVAYWKHLYECAQNANSFRQQALDDLHDDKPDARRYECEVCGGTSGLRSR